MNANLYQSLALLWWATTCSALAADQPWLWQIGQPDHDNAEFALAPGGYAQFTQDAVFVVGQSDTHHDWPYVQPGPADSWAGSRPHTFTVLFGIAQAVANGTAQLQVNLLDTQSQSPPHLRLTVNGRPFEQDLPAGAGDASVEGHPAQGKPFQFTVAFPASVLQAGNNVIDITTTTGCWLLYDSLAFSAPAGIVSAPVTSGAFVRSVSTDPSLVETNGQLCQPLSASVLSIGADRPATVRLGDLELGQIQMHQGVQDLHYLVPAVTQETATTLALTGDGTQLASLPVTLEPVRHWTVYILMHSHNDVGFTDIQPNIAKKQARNVTRALELFQETKDYPGGARFKWNLEVMLPADDFFATATPEQLTAFNQAVHDGNLGVDAMYANLLTGLCRSEELLRQFSFATALGRRCGVNVDSMMISDVPGLTWGVVPALAQFGVKYVSDGPNASQTMDGDRIGYVRVQWENHPFYWESPSGREKVLYWGSQGGYSFGHHFSSLTNGLPFLLQRLDEQKYAYDIVQLRWTKGDNGLPDEAVMPEVREWNATHAWPKLVIATTSEAFHAFEDRYGKELPTYRGDLTPYWEDGAASSSRETGINRHSADRLVQAETLWALLNPGKFPAADFGQAWKNIALYSEHTWGAYNSISQPDLPFVATQWKYKQAYALDANRASRDFLSQALGTNRTALTGPAVDVFNTVSWPRTDLVTLPAATQGDAVQDDHGQPVPSQRLSSGELIFLARDIPPFEARRYTIAPGTAAGGHAMATANTLTTPLLSVKLDPTTGDIVSLRKTGLDAELANGPINNYLYLPGGDVTKVQPSGPARITIMESGPLLVSLLVESDAPGCHHLAREVRLVDGLDRVDLADLVDKIAVRTVEGVHFGFAFNVPNPVVHINSPGAIGQPEIDQLPGACKNWFSVERWVDVANDQLGITWSTADAPLMELGGLTANLPRSQPNPNVYLKHISPAATLYSWVMNNHWHTNYRAEQSGPTWFRYSLHPHAAYDAVAATHFGVESTVPLIVATATGPAPAGSRLQIEPASVIATAFKPSDDGQALIVRLYNPTDQPQTARLHWSTPVRQTWLSSGREEEGSPAPDAIPLAKFELVTLRVAP